MNHAAPHGAGPRRIDDRRSETRQQRRGEVRGTLSLQGRELTAAELDRLTGDAVTYTVRLTLDGTTYTGTSRWPQDETAEPPHTRFSFDPPLPAFRP